MIPTQLGISELKSEHLSLLNERLSLELPEAVAQINATGGVALVAVAAEAPIGMIAISPAGEVMVCVAGDRRRHGVATVLFHEACRVAFQTRSFTRVFCTAQAGHPGHAFASKHLRRIGIESAGEDRFELTLEDWSE